MLAFVHIIKGNIFSFQILNIKLLAIFLHFCLLLCLFAVCWVFLQLFSHVWATYRQTVSFTSCWSLCVHLWPEGQWIPSTKVGPKPSQAPSGIRPPIFQSFLHHYLHQVLLGFGFNIFFLHFVVPIFI